MSEMQPWLGMCHLFRDDGESRRNFKAITAVFCDDREAYDKVLRGVSEAKGYRLMWTEEVFPAGQWIARHPQERDAAGLARAVHATHPVEAGALRPADADNGGEVTEEQSHLIIEEIKGIEPLDLQMGAPELKTVPDALYDALFGQPDPTEAEIEAAGGDVLAVPPMQTYAILDAAKVTHLPMLLEDSGLEHRCLFKGAAYDELKNVAPWIVRLEDGSSFPRKLFTGPKGVNGLWDREPGIYIRSRGTLDEMWKHFRKFTRVQDEKGKWFYFRFWESQPGSGYFRHIQNDRDRVLHWFYVGRRPLSALIVDTEAMALIAFTPALSDTDKQPNAQFIYSENERAAHRQGRKNKYEYRLRSYLIRQNAAFAKLQEEQQKELVKVLITQASHHGIHSERSVAEFAVTSLLNGKPLGDDSKIEQVLRSNKHEIDKIKYIKSFFIKNKTDVRP